MTVIRPNSISGVTSITALANEINVFKHDGVLAGLQLNGVNHHTSSGVSTFHTLNVLGNVSVGGTLTYQDVTNIDSVGVITARSGINISSGSLTIPDSIIHSGDTNTKIRFPANDSISFETGGTQRALFGSDGKFKHESTGAVAAEYTTSNGSGAYHKYELGSSGTVIGYTGSGGQLVTGSGADDFAIRSQANLVLSSGGSTERLRIDSSGNMGLGGAPIAPGHLTFHINNSTSSAATRFHMTTNGTGATASDGFSLSIDGSSSDVNLIQRESANMLFYTAGTERLRIASDGKIGVNNTSPTARLHVSDSSFHLARFTRSGGQAGVTIEGNNATEAVYLSLRTLNNTANSGCVIEGVDASGNGTSWIKLFTENDSTNAGAISLHTRPAGGSTTERLRIASNGAIGLGGANYGSSGQVLTSQGSGSAPQWASPSGILQTVYQIKGAFETEATNSNTSGTPESIIDGCQAQIQVTNANSKIMVTYAGFNFYSKRYGPALAYIDIGFADSSSSGVNFSVGDYSTLGTDGSGSHRKPKSPTSSDWYRGEAGPGCVRVLHTHGKAVGKYLYYTLMARQTYSSSNSPGYIFNGGSGYFTVTLQEIL